jgi:hypothetical protein
MARVSILFLALGAVITLPACGAPPLSAKAQNIITVRDAGQVKECSSLGKIDADVGFSSGMGTAGASDNKQTRINNALREKTAELGGTHVLVDDGALAGTSQEAEAYKCGAATPPSTPPAAAEPSAAPASP